MTHSEVKNCVKEEKFSVYFTAFVSFTEAYLLSTGREMFNLFLKFIVHVSKNKPLQYLCTTLELYFKINKL